MKEPWKLKLINQIETFSKEYMLSVHLTNGSVVVEQLNFCSVDKATGILIVSNKLSKRYVRLSEIVLWQITKPRG